MLTIHTLGKFQVMQDGCVLNDDNIRSAKLTKLLVYLIIHREKTLTMDEIASSIWQEEETNNPAGALKNLMYRLRNLLRQSFGEEEFILTNRGSYCFNPSVKINVDVEEFEQMYHLTKKENLSSSDAMYYLKKMIDFYQGDFMPQITEMHWIITMSTYYHSLFLSAIKRLSELYVEEKMYDELEEICNKALKYDNAEEELYYYLILARMKKNKMNLAMESYKKACKILKEELGIRNPEKLQKLYKAMLLKGKGEKAEQIKEVQKNMTEDSPSGVFVCGYPVFREIYRLEARKNSRLNKTEYILLFTVSVKNSEKTAYGKLEEFRVKNAMLYLETILKESLRIGDAATRYSESQYVVLLSSCTYECAKRVTERIISKFNNKNERYRNLYITANLEKVTMQKEIKALI